MKPRELDQVKYIKNKQGKVLVMIKISKRDRRIFYKNFNDKKGLETKRINTFLLTIIELKLEW